MSDQRKKLMLDKQRTILHVDDDPAMTKLVQTRLKKFGYQTEPLNNPLLAKEKLVANQYHVVLLDIEMPQQNGLDLLKEIKELDGGVQVIMLTGMVSLTTVLKSFRWGAEACLFKPLSEFEPLVEALDETFRKINRWWVSLEELSKRKKEELVV